MNVPGPVRVFDHVAVPPVRHRLRVRPHGPQNPNPPRALIDPPNTRGSAAPAVRGAGPWLAAALALGLAACGDAPHGPDVPEFDFTGDTVRIRTLGDTAGTAPDGASLRVVDERRWLHDRAVLDSSALGRGLFVARSPGKVGVRATLSGGGQRDLVVLVRPERPAVLELELPREPVDPGATARLRGYRLDELADGGVQVNGYAPEVLEADSANLRFRVPGSTDPEVCRGAGIGVVASDRGRVVGRIRYRVRRPGEVALEVGEARLLEAGTRCVQLAPRDSARYALAWVDVDAIENARDGAEGFARQIEPAPDLSTVTVADGVAPEDAEASGSLRTSVTGPLFRRKPDEARPRDVRREPLAADGTDCGDRDFRDPCAGFRSRETPWEVGDTFLTDLPDGRSGRARVVQVHDGYLAVALFEPDSASFGEDRREAYREAARTAMDVTVPRLRSDLTRTHPVTSDGSDQLLVLLSEFTTDTILTGAESALTYFDTDDAGRYPWVIFNLSAPWGGSSAFLATLSHELTHAWARQYLWETPSSGGERDWGLPTVWAEEGVAEFYAHETLRRQAGIGVTSNFGGWHDFSASATVQRYSSEARYAVGSLTRGYDDAASFLRDLAVRRTRAVGESWERATAEVARGALEGWYGYDEYGARRTGLTRRMRDVLGSGWSPPEAVLRWGTSQALDDRTDSPRFQNRAFRAVSGSFDCNCGWRPRATVVPGTAEEISVTRRYGSTDYFFLKDRGLGGSYQLSWSGTDEPVRWMVARFR